MTVSAIVPSNGSDNEKDVHLSAAHANEKAHHDTLESDDAYSSSTITVQSNPKRTWRSYLWDTFDKSPEERHFLFKLDAVILTFASLGYFIKYLDQVSTPSPIACMVQLRLMMGSRSISAMPTYPA